MSRRRDPRTGVWKVLPCQHRQILRLLRAGVAICRTAEIVGVGVRTVQRRVDLIRSMADGDDTGYRRSVRRRVCPVHGPVIVWPCVACRALAAKSATLVDLEVIEED